ncbi:MAG: hypothetical protein EXS30_09070 [Pedosphaera sp.]|nr:hypothetical protein [Pedosphaera sp.]
MRTDPFMVFLPLEYAKSLLILNGLLTYSGLCLIRKRQREQKGSILFAEILSKTVNKTVSSYEQLLLLSAVPPLVKQQPRHRADGVSC